MKLLHYTVIYKHFNNLLVLHNIVPITFSTKLKMLLEKTIKIASHIIEYIYNQ